MATRADITLKPAIGLTPEKAREARARAWAYIFFECYAKKKSLTGAEKAGGTDAGEDAKEEEK